MFPPVFRLGRFRVAVFVWIGPVLRGVTEICEVGKPFGPFPRKRSKTDKGMMMQTRRGLLGSMVAFGLVGTDGYAGPDFVFPSIDGGDIRLSELRGQPVLVVNTASLCAFTPQYDQLQALHEAYAGRAVILAVPSDDFGGQELADEKAVKEFCEVNFRLTLPMAEITRVRGSGRHPFYAWAAGQGVVPRWNFHKILIGPDGTLVADFATSVAPDSRRITNAIDALLIGG